MTNLKGTSDIVGTVHHLKIAQMHMDSFIAERPMASLTDTFKKIRPKIPWMYNELICNQDMPQIVRDGLRQEFNSDVLSVPAINYKVSLLSPQGRDAIEALVDQLLANEDFKIEVQEETPCMTTSEGE
jgi:hypothetical protein